MDVRKVTDVSDCMVLASGNSDRHVRSIADRVVERARAAGFRPMGVEGERDAEWVLVDLNDVIVSRDAATPCASSNGLEELWEMPVRPKAKAKAKAKAKSKSKSKPRAGKVGAARGKPRGKPPAAARGRKSTRAGSRSRG